MVLEIKSNGEGDEKIKFVNRIQSLPVVMATCMWLSHNYARLKATGQVMKQTCELAETILQTSVHALADPILIKFKAQIGLLDGFACAQLDRFETAFPLINKDTQTILAETKTILMGN